MSTPAAAVARDRIANVLLAYKGRSGVGGSARAAEDIARSTAKELLRPLLHTACARLAFVMRRTLDIAADCAVHAGEGLLTGPGVCWCVSACNCGVVNPGAAGKT